MSTTISDAELEELIVDATQTCAVEGCDAPRRPYGGRGARPKRCEEHSGAPAGAPPRAPAGRGDEPATSTAKKPSKADVKLCQDLADLVGLVALLVTFFDPYDGQVVAAATEPMAAALLKLARANPAVRRVLVKVSAVSTGGSTVLGLTLVTARMAAPILAHHGIVPPERIPPLLMTFAPTQPSRADQ